LSCTHLARHELESVVVIIVIAIVFNISIIIMIIIITITITIIYYYYKSIKHYNLGYYCAYVQAAVCVPVVLWLFLVQPISLRTMHDDEEEAHTGTPVPCCSRTLLFIASPDSHSTSMC